MVKERFIELIDRYLSGSATETERQLVQEYLSRLEAGEQADIAGEEEPQLKERMWQHIQQQAIPPVVAMPGRRGRVIRFIAVAASIVGVVSVGIIWFMGRRVSEPSVATQRETKKDSAFSVVYRETNTTGKEKRVQLPDGSLIVLADKSEISYRAPFTDRREVSLAGKAYFKVAKDKTRPFTVSSGDITTTALGTEFTVTAFQHARRIIVRLYEGKVVIKPVNGLKGKWKNDVYLVPGEAFVYGGETAANVKRFTVKNSNVPERILNGEQASDHPVLPQNNDVPWYMFNNQSLGKVLDDLAGMYNVDIIYDQNDVQGISFTGKYKRTDSLEQILKRISVLNNLTLTKKDDAYILSR